MELEPGFPKKLDEFRVGAVLVEEMDQETEAENAGILVIKFCQVQ